VDTAIFSRVLYQLSYLAAAQSGLLAALPGTVKPTHPALTSRAGRRDTPREGDRPWTPCATPRPPAASAMEPGSGRTRSADRPHTTPARTATAVGAHHPRRGPGPVRTHVRPSSLSCRRSCRRSRG